MSELEPLYSGTKPMKVAGFMSGSGTNLVKLIENQGAYEISMIFTDNPKSKATEISLKYKIPLISDDIREFYEASHLPMNDMEHRKIYDMPTRIFLEVKNIPTIALAGYDWVVTDVLLDRLCVNIHPGDLRVFKENGKRKYIGLGWIPSAKAILAGEENVYTSCHLVTPGLDEGPLLMVSAPQRVIMPAGVRREDLLEGKTLKEIIKNPEGHYLVDLAKEHQERLKVNGDWLVYPLVLKLIAEGRYARDKEGKLFFDGKPIPNGLNYEEAQK